MNDDTIIKLAIIVSLTIIAILGMVMNRLDVSILTAIVGAIAGLGGYYAGKMTRDREITEGTAD